MVCKWRLRAVLTEQPGALSGETCAGWAVSGALRILPVESFGSLSARQYAPLAGVAEAASGYTARVGILSATQSAPGLEASSCIGSRLRGKVGKR